MKIAIHDSKNTLRHLGDIEFDGPITQRHEIIRVATRGPATGPSFAPTAAYEMSHVEFTVDRLTTHTSKTLSPTVTERTTILRLVLITDLPLEDLLKLGRFTLPSETDREADYRRASAHHYPTHSRRSMTATEYAKRCGY